MVLAGLVPTEAKIDLADHRDYTLDKIAGGQNPGQIGRERQ